MKKTKYVIAIDPSVNNCGVAVFEEKRLIQYDILHPESKKDDWLVKAREMSELVEDVYELYQNKGKIKLVTEIPQHFGGAERGFLARESGAVLKLSFLAGMIYNIVYDVVAYEPNQWKGQLPKCVVRNRLQKYYPKLQLFGKTEKICSDCKRKHREHILDHNIVDAISIGHFHIHGKL